MNHSGTVAQVVSCHCYPVVFHPFVEQLTVCMSVCNRFTIQIYGFTHSVRTFLACAAHGASASAMEDLEDRR